MAEMTATTQEWDPNDPHHQHDGHHGHHIVHWKTLVLVLGALLFFTVLTVAASRAEIWFAQTFDVFIPDWVNVMLAMSIATIKAMMVVMFFMALKWDNPMNTVILLTTIFAFACFMGFTAIDLGNRGHVYDYKGVEVTVGGTGNDVIKRWETQLGPDGEPMRDEQGHVIKNEVVIQGPIAVHARERFIAAVGEEKFAELEAEHHHGAHDAHGAHALPDENHSAPRYGLTPGLFDAHAPAHEDGHGGGDHGADAAHGDAESAHGGAHEPSPEAHGEEPSGGH